LLQKGKYCLKIKVELVPPKPNELFIAMVISDSLAVSGVKSRSHLGSWLSKFIVGGITLLLIERILKIDSIAPAAPKVCPVIDLVELMAGISSLKMLFIAVASARSPKGVDVP
jgi:hypothetical protein